MLKKTIIIRDKYKLMLLPIKGYSILVYLDKSEFDDWKKTVLQLQKFGFEINCSRFI